MTSNVLRLHVGAHKTATTYLQSVLLSNMGNIARNGAIFWPTERTRPKIQDGLWSLEPSVLSRVKSVMKGEGLKPRHYALRALDDMIGMTRDVILSEENILGSPHDSFSGAIYPKAGARVEALCRNFTGKRIEVWLAVRSLSDFLSSSYGESLRHGFGESPEGLLPSIQGYELGWTHLIKSIIAARPDLHFVVWRYEDFAALEDKILTGLTGLPHEQRRVPARTDVRPSASAKAITEQIKALPKLDWKERLINMAALEATYPKVKGEAPYSLFEPSDAAELEAIYARDVAAISELDDVTFLRP